jgi:hypothetical protein
MAASIGQHAAIHGKRQYGASPFAFPQHLLATLAFPDSRTGGLAMSRTLADRAWRIAGLLALLAMPALSQPARGQNLDALAAPLLQSCETVRDRNWCRHGLKMMQDELPAARQGRYQAMRNIAFCLIDGCEGAVRRDRAGGCAWRRAIIEVHGRPGGRADKSDEANLALCKGWGF